MQLDKDNRICKMCSSPYKYCYSCGDFYKYPRWMVMFDKENCERMFDLICCYREGVNTKEEAIERLNNLSLDDFDKYSEKVQSILTEILSEDAKKEIVEDVFEDKEKELPKMRKRNKKNKVEQ